MPGVILCSLTPNPHKSEMGLSVNPCLGDLWSEPCSQEHHH